MCRRGVPAREIVWIKFSAGDWLDAAAAAAVAVGERFLDANLLVLLLLLLDEGDEDGNFSSPRYTAGGILFGNILSGNSRY